MFYFWVDRKIDFQKCFERFFSKKKSKKIEIEKNRKILKSDRTIFFEKKIEKKSIEKSKKIVRKIVRSDL